ncbi:MAG: hypothetical protein AAGF12_40875 [Myxococcota bacterium]
MMTWRRLLAVLMLSALVSGGVAWAQDDDDDEAEAEDEESEVDVTRRADLGPAEQMAEAERITTRGTQISRRVQTMLDEARRERDIIRVTCLNDKLTQINANLRTLEDRADALRTAVEGQDPNRRNHEFTVVSVLGQKFSVLEREANQCVGQDLFETGATRTSTTIDPEAPDEDPSVIPAPVEVPVPFIPPPSSPDE